MKRSFSLILSLFLIFSCATKKDAPVVKEEPIPEVVEKVEEPVKEAVVVVEEKVEEVKVNRSIFPEYVSIKDTERGKQLRFVPKARFEFAKPDLSDNTKKSLKIVGIALIAAPDAKVAVEGHTGNRGYAYPNNYKLSVERVKKAKEFLLNLGVKESQIIGSPLGEFLPEFDDQNELRRLEYIVIENDDDMKKYDDFLKTVDIKKEAK